MIDNDILSDYLQSLYGIEPLSTEEEHQLAKLIQQGDESALNRLVTHNLRFVVYLAKQMSAWNYSNVPVEDIIAIGNQAMFMAARKWKPTNNSKFATYAKPFILKGVKRELDNTSNIIRLPINVMESIRRLTYAERSLTQILGRKPNNKELSRILGIAESKVTELKHCMAREPISIDNLDTERFTDEQED